MQSNSELFKMLLQHIFTVAKDGRAELTEFFLNLLIKVRAARGRLRARVLGLWSGRLIPVLIVRAWHSPALPRVVLPVRGDGRGSARGRRQYVRAAPLPVAHTL